LRLWQQDCSALKDRYFITQFTYIIVMKYCNLTRGGSPIGAAVLQHSQIFSKKK